MLDKLKIYLWNRIIAIWSFNLENNDLGNVFQTKKDEEVFGFSFNTIKKAPTTYKKELYQKGWTIQSNMAILSNTVVTGKIGLAITGGRILVDSHLNKEYYLQKSGDIKSYLLSFVTKARHYQGDHMILSASVSNNYFMWICYFLPLLSQYEEMGLNPSKLQIWVRCDAPGFQMESLALLGYNNVKELNGKSKRVERLYVPSFRYLDVEKSNIGHYNILSRKSIVWLNNRFNDQSIAKRRVLISRRMSNQRRLVNESELLEKTGAELVILEKMSFADQVSLFSGVSVVIAPHGAGLTNLVFATGAQVFELYPTNRELNNPKNLQICEYLKHEYHLLEINEVKDNQDMFVNESVMSYLLEHIR